jgi:hypothetical protein
MESTRRPAQWTPEAGVIPHDVDGLSPPIAGQLPGAPPKPVGQLASAQQRTGCSPDIIPVDFGAIVTDRFEHGSFVSDDAIVLPQSGCLRELLGALRDLHLPVMAVVWSAGGVRTALAMHSLGLLPAPTVWQMGFTGSVIPGGLPPTPRQLDAFLDVLPRRTLDRSTSATETAWRWRWRRTRS